ncbi:unnamed protein product, partial [Laminaria digitata]
LAVAAAATATASAGPSSTEKTGWRGKVMPTIALPLALIRSPPPPTTRVIVRDNQPQPSRTAAAAAAVTALVAASTMMLPPWFASQGAKKVPGNLSAPAPILALPGASVSDLAGSAGGLAGRE